MAETEDVRNAEDELAAREPQSAEQPSPRPENEQWWRNDAGSGEVH